MKVFVVRIKHSNGNLGYHSVWANRELAERQLDVRGRGKGGFMEYFLEVKEGKPFVDFCRQTCVWFEDSVGGMVVI
mgnify:CR=1 FL=1